MKSIVLISNDRLWIDLVNAICGQNVLTLGTLEHLATAVFRSQRLFIVDQTGIEETNLAHWANRLLRAGHTLAVACHNADGKQVLQWQHAGVAGILFKSNPPDQICKEIKRLKKQSRYAQTIRGLFNDAEQIRQYLSVLSHLTTDRPVDEILQELLAAISKTYGLHDVRFYLAKEDHFCCKFTLQGFNQRSDLPPFPDPGGEALWRHLFIERRTLRASHKRLPQWLPTLPAGSLLVPLLLGKKPLGFLALLPAHRGLHLHFTPLMRAYAAQITLVIENARLFHDVIKTREELAEREKKALLGQMIISLNHEINNPLSIISMEAQLLQKRLASHEEGIENRLAKIDSNIDRIKRILERISALDLSSPNTVPYGDGKEMIDLEYEN